MLVSAVVLGPATSARPRHTNGNAIGIRCPVLVLAKGAKAVGRTELQKAAPRPK
jgi:hypothetical protein